MSLFSVKEVHDLRFCLNKNLGSSQIKSKDKGYLEVGNPSALQIENDT